MSISFYFDVHVRRAVTEGLRVGGVDVLTAQDDGADEMEDDELLSRATALDRVVFTCGKPTGVKNERKLLLGLSTRTNSMCPSGSV
jgi:hypothetical protein